MLLDPRSGVGPAELICFCLRLEGNLFMQADAAERQSVSNIEKRANQFDNHKTSHSASEDLMTRRLEASFDRSATLSKNPREYLDLRSEPLQIGCEIMSKNSR